MPDYFSHPLKFPTISINLSTCTEHHSAFCLTMAIYCPQSGQYIAIAEAVADARQ